MLRELQCGGPIFVRISLPPQGWDRALSQPVGHYHNQLDLITTGSASWSLSQLGKTRPYRNQCQNSREHTEPEEICTPKIHIESYLRDQQVNNNLAGCDNDQLVRPLSFPCASVCVCPCPFAPICVCLRLSASACVCLRLCLSVLVCL